jgi:hypothetical protein
MIMWLIEKLGVTNAALHQFALTGAFSFAGVVVTGVLAILTWFGNQWALRRERRTARDERHDDLRLAIWAEIHAIWQFLINVAPEKKSPEKVREVFAAKRAEPRRSGYTPFISAPPRSVLFDGIRNDLFLLKADEIPQVVGFYRHLAMLGEFAQDLRTAEFARLDLDRKEQMLIHYIRMLNECEDHAVACLKMLEFKIRVPAGKRLAAG